MKSQIKFFVEKLNRFSKELGNDGILLEQPWIKFSENNNQRCVFIFRKERKELLISRDGIVEKGKWDYIPSMNSLLIENDSDTILYQEGFLDDSIMILKRDGTDIFELFVNENRIESTIENLLKKIKNKYVVDGKNKIQPRKIITKKLEDGTKLDIHCSFEYGYNIGDRVTIDGQKPKDGRYKFGWLNAITVSDGVIKKLR